MKSAVFYGKQDIRIEELDMPVVGDNDVLIQVKACGVCGTDVHIFEGDKGAAAVMPPTILGHEFSGVISKLGKNVTRYKIGDRVCVDPNNYCGSCDFCREGIAHYCEKMIGYGTTVNGGFAQYCSVHEKQVYPLGKNTSFEQGAMAEPVACCIHGIDMCEIQPGCHVVVIGGGMIGMLMIQLAKLVGASKVVLIEPVQGKREVAKKIGADYCIDPITENVRNKLIGFGIKRVNTVIECVGNPKTIQQAIELAGNKSVVMMFGLTKPDEEISVRPFEIFQKEVVLKASFINPYTQKRALELIDTQKIDVSCMIYEVAPLNRLCEILGSAELRRIGKYIINPEM